MTKQRSLTSHPHPRHGRHHRKKPEHKYSSAQGNKHPSEMPPPQILPFSPGPDSSTEIKRVLTWPLQLFNMFIMPWRGSIPTDTRKRSNHARWNPEEFKVQNKETDTAYLYKAVLPGIMPKHISLSIRNRSILMQIKQSEVRLKKGGYRHSSYTTRRSLDIPVYTRGDAITAVLDKHGVLVITIPKSDKPCAPDSATIPIHSGH
jgi:HSP20 family molecular chaperone IbpA